MMTLSFVSTGWVMLQLVLLPFLLDVAAAKDDNNDHASLLPCGDFSGIGVDTRAYHNNGICNRAEFNMFKQSLNRGAKRAKLQAAGGAHHLVPDQKTVICPPEEETATNDLLPPPGKVTMTGFDTVWMVENRASRPIVVAYVNQQNGLEYSAVNSHITPATEDPQTILQPMEWKPIFTYEGHVFHVRELRPDGTPGRLLVQHRVGLVPIGANMDPALLVNCPLQDVEPVKNPNFQRTPALIDRPCNSVDVGFRNVAGCPIHGYFVNTHNNDGNGNDNTCTEEFKFHLGVHATTDDFMQAWPSTTKYESSFMGHTYAFRLASNPAVLVGTHTLRPTAVHDCPTRTAAAGVTVGSAGLLAAVQHDLFQNATDSSLLLLLSSLDDYYKNVTLPNMPATTSGLVYTAAGLTSL